MSRNTEIFALRERVDLQNEHLRKHVEVLNQHIRENTALAAQEMTRRLNGMNEIREQLERVEKTFMPREVFDASIQRVETDLRVLRELAAEARGKASQSAVLFAGGLGIAGLLLGVASLVVNLLGR